MTVYVCQDCGQPAASLLCTACTKTAAALGLSIDDRLAQLRVVPLVGAELRPRIEAAL